MWVNGFFLLHQIVHQVLTHWIKLTCELLILAYILKLLDQNGWLPSKKRLVLFNGLATWGSLEGFQMALHEACCGCVCLKKAWRMCPSGSPAHAITGEVLIFSAWLHGVWTSKADSGQCLISLSQETKARFQRFSLFFSSLKLWTVNQPLCQRDSEITSKINWIPKHNLITRITEHPKVPHMIRRD